MAYLSHLPIFFATIHSASRTLALPSHSGPCNTSDHRSAQLLLLKMEKTEQILNDLKPCRRNEKSTMADEDSYNLSLFLAWHETAQNPTYICTQSKAPPLQDCSTFTVWKSPYHNWKKNQLTGLLIQNNKNIALPIDLLFNIFNCAVA